MRDLQYQFPLSRRRLLAATACGGVTGLANVLSAASQQSSAGLQRKCIILYCWGGMSHHDTFDMKPNAPSDIRGEFHPIASSVSGIQISEHLPRLAREMRHLAIVRSIHHDDSAHGRGMYWNLTGHRPPRVGNIPPESADWPSFPAMVSCFREAPAGVPNAVRLPYPMVDNGTLQAGEYGGFLGARFDPIVIRTPSGREFGGVSRALGSQVLQLGEVDSSRLRQRHQLRTDLELSIGQSADFEDYAHYRDLAREMLLSSAVKDAYDLTRESPAVREMYGDHIGGHSALLARRLTEAGVPIVQVCCAAGDLNGGQGDMWDTHGNNFARLKNNLLPVFDQAMSALIRDLDQRGTLEETLVVMLTDFGRTPRINGAAGRDHYPGVYSVVLAGGGIQGGQVYGSSDASGSQPADHPCGPADVHATLFQQLGISPRATIFDMLNRPLPVCDGQALPIV